MSYEIAFEHHGSTLVARLRGRRPEDDAAAGEKAARAWLAIGHEARRCNAAKVLIVAEVEGHATSTNAHRMASAFESFGFDKRMRIACVFMTPEIYRVNRLGVLVAADHGWDIDTFPNEQEAWRWLEAAPSSRF